MARIIRAIAKAAPTIASLVEESERAAEKRRQEWELERQRLEERDRIRRREKARAEATQQLLEIMERWGESQRIQSFFEQAERQAGLREGDERARLLERLGQARALIGDTDALSALAAWKTPEERER